MTAHTAPADDPAASDEALAARRDVTALYERYGRRLVPFLASLGVAQNDLDDLHQEVWMRVWNALGTTPFQGHFRGWLFQLARNLIIDRSRGRRPTAVPLPAQTPLLARTEHPLSELSHQEVRAQLAQCLQHLEQREAEVFRGITGGADYDEVCQRLAIKKETAYKLFHQAKTKLASCMERAGL